MESPVARRISGDKLGWRLVPSSLDGHRAWVLPKCSKFQAGMEFGNPLAWMDGL